MQYYDVIVGLDPAGPNWDLPGCSADPVTCKLNPQDAQQVFIMLRPLYLHFQDWLRL